MNTCSTPTLDVRLLFACTSEERFDHFEEKESFLRYDFREGRALDQRQQVQK